MVIRQPNIDINHYVNGERCISDRGTRLVRTQLVNRRSAYKESMLLLGILVALIVLAVTFWSIQKKPVLLDKMVGSSTAAYLPGLQKIVKIFSTEISPKQLSK